MYDWLVGVFGAGGTLGLVFGGLLLLFLFGLGIISWQVRHIRKSYSVPAVSYDEVQAASVAAAAANFGKRPIAEEAGEKDKDAPRRLTLCDSVMIDEERRLVLVRRDDVEHLIMVGSAGDMVIEHNIPVEPPPLDTVSMLAIARAEETPFMMLGESKVGNLGMAGQSLERADMPEAQASNDRVNAPFFHIDETSPDLSADNPAAGQSTESHLAEENDLAATLMQVAGEQHVEQADKQPEADAPIVPVPSPSSVSQEPSSEAEGVMTAIFPQQVAPVLPTSLNIDPHLGVASALMPETPNEIAPRRLEEPPVASYFAGGPKTPPEPQLAQTPQPLPVTLPAPIVSAPAPVTSPPVEPTPTAPPPADPTRILSLNPFIKAPAAAIEEPAPVSSPPVQASQERAEQPVIAAAQVTNVPAAPPPSPSSASPLNPSFINSFLGFPLAQLAKKDTLKTDASPPPAPSTQAHLLNPSQPATVQLKKPAS